MQELMELWKWLISYLEHISRWEMILMSIHTLVVFSSRSIFRVIRKAQGISNASASEEGLFNNFQKVNIFVLLMIILNVVFLPLTDHSWFTKVLSALLIISGAYLADSVVDIFLLRRFGKLKSNEGDERVYLETYRSRLISLMTTTVITIGALIIVIRLFGFESLLEAGGVIGLLGVFLALTQGAWAPDLISGLIILNSNLVEEGDVIELSEKQGFLAIVFKTKLFHTELLNISNNHRVMMPNAQLRQQTLHNLSKFASAKGLRESLSFKIGYDAPSSKIKVMFESAFQEAWEREKLPILNQFPLEIRVIETGDYAVTWKIFYYTKDVKVLLNTRQRFLEIIHERALLNGISLATPILYQSVEAPDSQVHLQAQSSLTPGGSEGLIERT